MNIILGLGWRRIDFLEPTLPMVIWGGPRNQDTPCENQRRQWHPTPVLLPGKSHGRRSLVGCDPWGREESDTTEWLHFHFSLSCIGEGNGSPLQCSCLENPGDGGGRLWGPHRVGHDWSDLAAAAQTRKNYFVSWAMNLLNNIPVKLGELWLNVRNHSKPMRTI